METIDAVLAEVRDLGPVTAAEISVGLRISESTARRALRRLEDAGLVESDTYQKRARVYLPVEEEQHDA